MESSFVESYSVLKTFQRPSVRSISRRLALDALSLVFNSTGKTDSLLRRPRVQFLYIHHIFKDEEKPLEKLIEKLATQHSFISYTEAVDRILSGTIDKPYIVMSSDDGLKNNSRAATVLANYGISACFFICPPMIGENNFEKIAQFSNQRLHLPPVEFMNWDDIERLQTQGHEIGGHTMSHVNLALCSAEDAQQEIKNCFTEIKQRCGMVKHFAFPFGRFHHFSESVKNIVFEAGFSSCASAERGCHITTGNRINKEDLFIRRDHIILSWPLDHVLFFMARNVQKASIQNNYYPAHANRYIDK